MSSKNSITITADTRPDSLFKRSVRPLPMFDTRLIVPAVGAAFRKLDPRTLVKNPVMFCVEIVSVLTTFFFLRDLVTGGGSGVGTSALFSGQITLWLWFTVLFANFAEAVAEGRGKAQGAGRHAPADAHRHQGQAAHGRDRPFLRPGRCGPAQARRHRAGGDRRLHSQRWRRCRRRRLG